MTADKISGRKVKLSPHSGSAKLVVLCPFRLLRLVLESQLVSRPVTALASPLPILRSPFR